MNTSTNQLGESKMSKQQFIEYKNSRGVYEAALCAAIAGIAMATVQLWIRG